MDPVYYNDPLDVPVNLDDEELRRDSTDPSTSLTDHLHRLQAEAYKVHPYPCVRRWNFARYKIKRNHLGYDRALADGHQDRSVILIDAGCCMGTDIRSLVAEGFPADQLLGTDLDDRFLALGYKLFMDEPSSPSTPAFLAGDLFSTSFLAAPAADASTSTSASPAPALNSLTSLTPLLGRAQLAHKLFALLSRTAGSTVFGSQLGSSIASLRDRYRLPENTDPEAEDQAWCHSPESWKKLWADLSEESGVKLRVMTALEDRAGSKAMPIIDDIHEYKINILVWCVTVL
ncbi:BZ3500_MvSof-1268-A1-R1_Chr1-3g02013 [Microbotryum saponariae]|uniref:BZ3500_MvSof-1268-A1-R1_Chr1-3g02013 protein n=1 Tax=Microbotryum saponariae TaxID=289078 RepID=A0A2X0KSD8_9BASI|nr:BZ3500_MvSof-1268-A1-R1_Chr1-3g02013 [Microbotryum saponariae]SCZ95158.1 BZ3501_MvSof-1269-A2-R1_Chr1-3g01615 [Microbotryum saponariae]